MTRVLDARYERLGSKGAILGFAEGHMRKLTLEGDPVYDLSIDCNTCSFLFQRVGVPRPGVVPVSILSDRLREGLVHLEEFSIAAFASLLPESEYLVALLKVRPTLVKPGDDRDYFLHESVRLFGLEPPLYDLPANPKTPYYRLEDTVFEPPGKRWGSGPGATSHQLRAS